MIVRKLLNAVRTQTDEDNKANWKVCKHPDVPGLLVFVHLLSYYQISTLEISNNIDAAQTNDKQGHPRISAKTVEWA
jgi:hypothetical protein